VYSNALNITVDIPTGIYDSKSELYDFRLEQNYPNPFNPVTKINYTVYSVETLHRAQPKGETMSLPVLLKVYNILGNEVATLVNSSQQPGNYEVEFNGSELSSGVYLYKIRIGDKTLSRKMILMK
jgi:hypothetical protein